MLPDGRVEMKELPKEASRERHSRKRSQDSMRKPKTAFEVEAAGTIPRT